jgi:hypothetical protein
MTRDELVAFDREMTYRFTPENFKQAVYDQIDDDYARLNEMKAFIKNEKADKQEGRTLLTKSENVQGQELSRTKNQDEVYKALARQYVMNKNEKFYEKYPHFAHQDKFYAHEFDRAALRPPPKIDEYEYTQKENYGKPSINYETEPLLKDHVKPE